MPGAPPQCVGVTDCWDQYMFATDREQVLSVIGSITLPCIGREGRCASRGEVGGTKKSTWKWRLVLGDEPHDAVEEPEDGVKDRGKRLMILVYPVVADEVVDRGSGTEAMSEAGRGLDVPLYRLEDIQELLEDTQAVMLGEMDVASATVGDFDSALHILAGLKCALLEVRRAHLATQAEITEMRPRINEVRRDLRKARATVVNLEA
ncbi:hypothetical protein Acr_17g0000770 [Actinidia rufa]|uniref:Uncharacterized protein n=1 Tax=Actinidia rufa TaxID=165716 RepID=A0A7J0G0Q2_9ERIC|nr:hypothetical protein Acr_17g0000770 [Actinidia rufa]